MRLLGLTSIVMVAFAANSVLNRAALTGGGNDPLSFAAQRVVAGAITLAVIVVLRGGRLRLAPGHALGAAVLSLYLVGFSLAYARLDAGAGALILFGGVQVTMFGGAVLAGDAIPARRWAGSALAMLGLLWMFWPGETGVPLLHGAMMAAAALGWGVYSLIGRGVSDPLAVTAASFLIAVPVCVAAMALGPDPLALDARGIVLALVSGAFTSGLGYAAWYAIVPQLGATRAALSQLSVPVIAVLGGVLLLGESITLRLFLACALVVGGIALGLRRTQR